MSDHDSEEIRSAAESLLNHTRSMDFRSGGGGHLPPGFDITRTHSINLITEEFLGGYMQDGRMSVVRRFFCLFVTFDLFFVSLLWLICIMLTGDNIFHAFQKQIVHYTVYTSLFDVVAAAICRFIVLIFFYALLYTNHWLIIALSTSFSCLFLISKVFLFDWVNSSQQVFEVILIITSFVLAWGEAWFFDCRVIPQERHARRYFSDVTSATSDRSPLMAPFLASQGNRTMPESVANFYSPLDSASNSDVDDQDEDYREAGLHCLRNAYELLESSDWKIEKVNSKGDTIKSTHRDKLGKIYRLTARIKYPAKALMEELFYKVEDIPKWNPTLLESKIIHKINSYTDITYQVSAGGGGGIVKSRDFVNLRCWRLFRNGKIVDDITEVENSTTDDESSVNRSYEGSVVSSVVSDFGESTPPLPSSVESYHSSANENRSGNTSVFQTLSKSLGAKDFNAAMTLQLNPDEPPPLSDEFEDAKDNLDETEQQEQLKGAGAKSAPASLKLQKDIVWLSAAISTKFHKAPTNTKHTRGENLISGFAMREIDGKKDACIFEWLLCLDIKGYMPRKVLDTALSTFMTDYMIYMRKYIHELRQKRSNKVPKN